MLYPLHELQRLSSDAISAWTELLRHAPVPWVRAQASLLHRITKGYPKPGFEIPGVVENVILTRPFCRLVHFAAPQKRSVPRVLVIAPLSGHHASLVRDTVATLLQAHDVYVTDWLDARDVPLTAGTFSLDAYVTELRGFIQHLGAAQLHVVAVCQPTVPALAAISLDAAAGAPAPRSLVLMGGPVDARRNPTVVDKLATDHPLAWFEQQMIHRVPERYAGAGRRVYPGFLQLSAFVMMNPDKHVQAYWQYWLARLRGDDAAAALHEKFYDEYNAVLDMDASYYLDTVRIVFQEFALARGTWRVGGELVDPSKITATPIFTIEGELDDISGLGQTAAALELAANAPVKRELVAAGCGHYGLFSGSRWREAIYPEVRSFIGECS
ncbi:MAG: polyhydroxyalkanoate depolymerase [Deltaproteobacteria bacterium]